VQKVDQPETSLGTMADHLQKAQNSRRQSRHLIANVLRQRVPPGSSDSPRYRMEDACRRHVPGLLKKALEGMGANLVMEITYASAQSN